MKQCLSKNHFTSLFLFYHCSDYELPIIVSYLYLQLIVNLTDVNDNSPWFPSLSPILVEENRVVGSIVAIVTATDADQGNNAAISYSILSGNINGQ